MNILKSFTCAIVLSGFALSPVCNAQAPVPVAPAPTPTLWSFLGVPQGAQKLQGALLNRRGNRPGLDPKPPLKAINDPRNLYSPDKSIKKAAQVKEAEDLKPQKIKAIKYLASIGCGCYDKDGSVTDALIAASEDCTEEVRYVALTEIHKAASGKCCNTCGSVCCCKEALLKQMAKIAFERDDTGCPIEPSARVRCAAIAVLKQCCPSAIPPNYVEEEKKVPVTPPPVDDDVIETPKKADEGLIEESGKSTNLRQNNGGRIGVRVRESSTPVRIHDPATAHSSSENPGGGVVIGYDQARQLAYVHFEDPEFIAEIGSVVHLKVDPARGSGFRGTWKVTAAAPGRANLVPIDLEDAMLTVPGDHVMLGEPPVAVVTASFKKK